MSKEKVIGIVVAILLIISIILIAKSVDTVDPQNYGLKCNSLSKNCDMSRTYTGGRYFIGLTYYFIALPAYQKTMEYSSRKGATGKTMVCRTADGFSVGLEVSFQYQLIKQNVGDLYKKYAIKYEQSLDRFAKDLIMQTAANYYAQEYWEKRYQIQQDMKQTLDAEFMKAFTRCMNFQILQINLPSIYEDKIVETQVEIQQQKQKKLERNSTLIRASINVLQSETDQKVLTLLAQANAQAYSMKQNSTAYGLQQTIQSEVTVTSKIQNDLGLTGKQLQQYVYYNGIMNKNTNMFIGTSSTLVKTQPVDL